MDLHLPTRPKTGHKGTFGTVATFGGNISSPQVMMLGGPAFVAKAAIRSGVGLVVFIGSKELLTHLIKLVPQAVGITATPDFSETAKKWQSIVIGPGLGINKDNIGLINALLSLKLPTVVDADGLNILAKYPQIAEYIHEKCVLTPHPKEFERLAKTLDIKSPDGLAEKLSCTVVLKDSDTYVSDGVKNWCNEAKNPVLATGGTGDALAGLIGGLLAQYSKQLSVFECACLGVEIHAKAAAKWQSRHGSGGLIIDELLELIPETMEKMRQG